MRTLAEQTYPTRVFRAAAPAPAREVIRQNTATSTDAVADSVGAPCLEPRLAALRALVREGQYRVDVEALSKKIVNDHLGRER